MFARYSLNRLLVLLATAGYLFLTADTVIEHWPVFSREPMSFVPVGFGGIAFLAGIWTILRWDETWIQRLHVIFFAAFVISGLGMYLHIENDDDPGSSSAARLDEREKPKPLLAPLAFGAVAVVGLLGTSRRWPAEVVTTAEGRKEGGS